MRVDDRFDDLVASLGGFYRTWYVYVGLELGPVPAAARRRARRVSPPTSSPSAPGPSRAASTHWAWGADAHDLVAIEDGRITLPDGHRGRAPRRRPLRVPRRAVPSTPRSAASTTRDLLEVFRTRHARRGPARPLPRRHRAADRPGHRGVLPGGAGRRCRSSSRDLAARGPDPRRPLRRRPLADRDGAPVPGTTLVGVEFEPDSVARARANVAAAVLTDRITIEQGDVDGGRPRARVRPRLLPVRAPPARRPASRRSGRRGTRCAPDGWLVALDWYLPSEPDELRSRHGELHRRRPARRARPGHAARVPQRGPRLVRRRRDPDAGAHRPAVGRHRDPRPPLTREPSR